VHLDIELAGALRDERRAELARELSMDLSHIDGVAARPATRSGEPGVRSGAEIPVLGQIALALISSGAVVALVECLKAYVQRERRLVVRMKRKDGAHFELEAERLKAPEVERTLAALREFFRDVPDAQTNDRSTEAKELDSSETATHASPSPRPEETPEGGT